MDDTTNTEELQGQEEFPMGELTPEEAKASLGLATRLSEGHLAMMNPQPEGEPQPEASPEAPQAPTEEAKSKVEERAPQEDLEGKMADMEKRIMDGLKREVDSIRSSITEALDDES